MLNRMVGVDTSANSETLRAGATRSAELPVRFKLERGRLSFLSVTQTHLTASRRMLPLLLAAAALPFIVARPTSLTRRQETTCPTAADSPLSCPSPAGVDSCCTITPGGQLLQ